VNRAVAVLDLGAGELAAISAALEAAGAEVVVTNQRSEIMSADAFVIYGTSEFSSFLSELDKSRAAEIVDSRLAGGKAVLGIGAGLHAMFENSAEKSESIQGLAQWPGEITKLECASNLKTKLSEVLVATNSKLFQGVENEYFYFDQTEAVLDFSLQVDPPFVAPKVSYSKQDVPFIAAVENGPLTGIGFFPEQSGAAGTAVLRNWLGTL
jgi:imidazole glycerol-phosphate synthase subunit HisH